MHTKLILLINNHNYNKSKPYEYNVQQNPPHNKTKPIISPSKKPSEFNRNSYNSNTYIS